MRYKPVIAVFFLCLFLFMPVQDVSPAKAKFYENSYALVIGIDTYPSPWMGI